MATEHTVSRVALRARRGTLAQLALLVACASALVAAPTLALAAPAPFAFADKNNNGVFDAGIDTDITEDLKNGFVATTESLVLPDTMKSLTTRNPLGLTLIAGKHITLGGDLSAAATGAGITVVAESGTITILRSARLRASEFVSLSAAADITVGEKVTIAASARGSVVSLTAGGHVVLRPDVRVRAGEAIDLTATTGHVTVVAAAHFIVPKGTVTISSGTNVVVNGSHIQAADLAAFAGGHVLDFQDNRVTAPRGRGWAMLYAAGSTITVSGTTWTNIGADKLLFVAPEVIR